MAIVKNEKITSRDEDFAKWYTDIVKQAHLAYYTSIKGCIVFEPYAFAIWENMQAALDKMFKETGHENLYMPMFIPESLLKKEAEHVEGFAPEAAWVTYGGKNQLEERLAIRPTSETLFCDYYSSIINSYRDLPKLYNQWCSVVRWEKSTRPFLRTREFLWQEGHTIHETAEEAQEETLRMLNIYKKFFEDYLAIPVLVGKKTEKEKFAGAEYTLSLEALMYDGVSLQSATSHYFGQKFSIPFNVKFVDSNNKLQNVYQTSWGSSTRMIGALIMVHGDDNGLVLPPKIAPKQIVIATIRNDENVLKVASEIESKLKACGHRVILDTSDKSAGFKFAEYEMKGVPLRIEIGPRDIVNGNVVFARRDNGEKETVKIEDISDKVAKVLELIQKNMYDKALKHTNERTYTCTDLEEVKKIMYSKPGFIKAMWCGDPECELKMKEIRGMKSRCIPFEEEHISDHCIVCGKKAKHMVYWGIQY